MADTSAMLKLLQADKSPVSVTTAHDELPKPQLTPGVRGPSLAMNELIKEALAALHITPTPVI